MQQISLCFLFLKKIKFCYASFMVLGLSINLLSHISTWSDPIISSPLFSITDCAFNLDSVSTIFMKGNFFFLIISSIFFTFYYGFIGIFPIDSFLIYDAGYKLFNGYHPFRDYWSITGPILDYIQFVFDN